MEVRKEGNGRKEPLTNPLGLAKRSLLDGLMVPVDEADEADDAEEESSSGLISDKGFKSFSRSSSPSSGKSLMGRVCSTGRSASLALTNDRCSPLMMEGAEVQYHACIWHFDRLERC